jgi:hypothetical protein
MARAATTLRQPDLYWKQLQQLKAASICIRLYRNQLAKWVRNVELTKVIASSGGIAGWVIWKDLPFVWTGIIAAAQFLDATKSVLPFAKHHRAAGDLTVAMELICIDAEAEWEGIFAGELSDAEINKRRTRLRKLQLEAEQKHFPEGFEPGADLIALAEQEAKAYFELTYSEESAT